MNNLCSFISFLLLAAAATAIDVFCGSLTVYEQRRFGLNSFVISSQSTSDLKQCLELCCNIPNCRGVTLLGIITGKPGDPNCQLVGCRGGDCLLNARAEFNDGLISVVLNRDPPTSSTANVGGLDSSGLPVTNSITSYKPSYTTAASITIPEEFDIAPPSQAGTHPTISTTTPHSPEESTENERLSKTLQPVWAVGLAIVIAVCCVGLSLGLLSAYICYRRQKSRKQRAEISQPKLPTLHAFNSAY